MAAVRSGRCSCPGLRLWYLAYGESRQRHPTGRGAAVRRRCCRRRYRWSWRDVPSSRPTLLCIAVLGLIVTLWKRRLPAIGAGAATFLVAFWTLAAISRADAGDPLASRYVYVGAVFILLLAARCAPRCWVADLRRSPRWPPRRRCGEAHRPSGKWSRRPTGSEPGAFGRASRGRGARTRCGSRAGPGPSAGASDLSRALPRCRRRPGIASPSAGSRAASTCGGADGSRPNRAAAPSPVRSAGRSRPRRPAARRDRPHQQGAGPAVVPTGRWWTERRGGGPAPGPAARGRRGLSARGSRTYASAIRLRRPSRPAWEWMHPWCTCRLTTPSLCPGGSPSERWNRSCCARRVDQGRTRRLTALSVSLQVLPQPLAKRCFDLVRLHSVRRSER